MDKKELQKQKNKERKRIKNDLDFNLKKTIARMEPKLIADYITKKVLHDEPELSGVELAERTVPETLIASTETFDLEPTLQNLGAYFEKYDLYKYKKRKDLTLVLCMSAIRVCDVVRSLRETTKGAALKLIKQNKFDYDKRCLKSPAHVACSTPGRILNLREKNILDFQRIKKVVLDSSFLDVKQRSVLEIEGCLGLIAVLSNKVGAQIYLY